MSEQDNVKFIEDAFVTFNAGDADGLMKVLAEDAVQHMPGNGPISGDYAGRDAVLGMYAQIGEATSGTFQAVLESAMADGPDKVVAKYRAQAERMGTRLDNPRTITFTIKDGAVVDLLEEDENVAIWDMFFGTMG